MTDLSHLRGLIERATDGPWAVSGVRRKIVSGKRTYVYHAIGPDDDIAGVWFDERTGLGFADAHLIVAAVNSLPALLDEIEQSRSAIAAVRAVIDSGYRGVDKADKCEHGRYGFEDCIACYDEALLAALTRDMRRGRVA